MVAILSVLTASVSLLLASHYVVAQAPSIDPSQIPSQCQSKCQGVVSTTSSCGTDITCICKDAVVDALASCFSCAAGLNVGLTAQSAQSILDQFGDGCKTAGHPVKKGTVSASSGGGSGTTAASGSSPSSGGGSSGNGATSIGAKNSGVLAIVALGATLLLA